MQFYAKTHFFLYFGRFIFMFGLSRLWQNPKKLALVFLPVCCLAILVARHSGAQVNPASNQHPLASLRVCSDAGFLPFEMKSSSGQWEGFDVDMMQAFATSKGRKLEMIQISFDGIIPALLSGKCELIAAGMTVTPNRSQVVAFSHTTFVNGISIGIKNSPENINKYKSISDLDQLGHKIAVKTGYTSDVILSKLLKKAQILRFDQDADLYLAVLQERATAFVSDSSYVQTVMEQIPHKFFRVPTPISVEKFSIAARKQDTQLIADFNQFLVQWKKDGGYAKTFAKYFKVQLASEGTVK